MFSDQLKKLRTREGLSQAKFAQEIGFSQSAITTWENQTREPGINALIKVAEYFNVSVDYLIGKPNTKNFAQKIEKPADLSDDELTLIEKYRRLQTGYQVLIGNQIQVLLDHQKKSELPAQQEYGSQKKTKQ